MKRTLLATAAVMVLLAVVPNGARGQDTPTDAPATQPTSTTEPPASTPNADPGHTSASVAAAPKPSDAKNEEVGPDHSGEGWLWVPRVALFPVRVVGEVVTFPIHWGLLAYEKYSVGPRVKGIFFNEDGTVGLYPTALIETGFGLNVGGRLILRRIVKDIGLTSRAGFGGRFSQIYSTKISTNDSFERFEFDLESVYEIRPQDRFYGIGNGEELEDSPAMPLDPFGDGQTRSRFKQNALRVGASAGYRLHPNLTLSASGVLAVRDFGDGEQRAAGEGIVGNFETDRLTGFTDGSQTLYGEVELSYDTRRSVSRWEGESTPSTGSLFQVYAGYTLGLGDDPARYVRYGADLQRYFRLGASPRTLALRLYGEGVTGAYNEVSFYNLPRLGGPLILRGFDQDRFRDRVATMGSAEYQFDAVEFLSGFVFADVGRVYSDLDDLELTGMQLGFGGGIELHTKGSFLGRLTLATSIDGGFFATLSFDPVYDVKARVERK